ncbi:hypothetical protein HMPREF1987_00150 [Peptostreptococcaceae bacterium oral taxon 113 str. W5053]|nr:hypothetical protein HMPREF1987_00150 [Peptostreptococcaceae bacterium oral taxon 113 str. W5053]
MNWICRWSKFLKKFLLYFKMYFNNELLKIQQKNTGRCKKTPINKNTFIKECIL